MIVREQAPAYRLAVSALLVAVLATQAAATFGLVDDVWPMLDYGMYGDQRDVGDEIPRYVLVAKLDDGTTVRLKPEDCGLNEFKYQRRFVAAARRGDSKRVRIYLGLCRRVWGHKVDEIRVENWPIKVDTEGFQELGPRIERRIPFDS